MLAQDLRIGDRVHAFKRDDLIIKAIVTKELYDIDIDSILICSIDKKFISIVKLEDIHPIVITKELIKELGFIKHDNKYLDWKEYKLETDKGFIEISNTSNTVGKDWFVYIDNLDHEGIGSMDIQYLHELQHIIWDCLHIELKINKK